ncbi:MAG: NAD-dependent epimerase/dehydratase family protein [Bacteroidia bacterium]|nr:NAD-dependent epimerase/dehydratase family protein [Bacteroidia bacterium]NNC84452.1 NAD-dependent epimerase/dehydratase family protein [Bacteroidia bacterium]
MDKVFVTGANGLLGTNLVKMLTSNGYAVCALVRNKKSFVLSDLQNLTLIEGDLLDSERLSEQIKGCKYVVHIAANTSQNLLKPEDYYSTNVTGTQNTIKACIDNQVKKLTYIGTANTFGYGSLLNPGNELQPMKSPFTKSLYALSKYQAQEFIDKAASQLNITTISPTFMIGAYDTKPSSGRVILRALNKNFIFYPSGGKNFIHVSDVAISIMKAFDLKQSGEKFILGNENLSYKEFYKKVVLLNNQKTTLLAIPNFFLSLIGLIGDVCRLFKTKTAISSVNTKILTTNSFYTNKKAKQELKIEFTPIDKAITDSLNYFKKYAP